MTDRYERPKAGETVIVLHLPAGFLDELPLEDQEAISSIVGKPINLNDYDELGRGELEFRDAEGHLHLIYLSPDYFRAAN